MSKVKVLAYNAWDYFKVPDPVTFRHHYSDITINRDRAPKPKARGKLAQLLEVFDWYPKHYSAYERQFLFKVDICVLVFTALSFFTKVLDSSNVSNAYVSGMKEELNLNGNELNYFSTCFNIGYCIFQIPLILLIQKQSFARYLLIGCELCWGLCTFYAATVGSANQLYFVRFLVGISEAVSFPGSYVIMSTWYTPEELVRRAGFYNFMSSVGSVFSGLLQTACHQYLDGLAGRSGWRWQFIIDGLITLFCTFYGFLFFPGTPATTKRFGLLSEDDLVFARHRMANKVALPKNFSKRNRRRILNDLLFTWQPYVLVLLWVGHHQVHYESDLKLYIKSLITDPINNAKYNYGPLAPTNFAAASGALSAICAFIVPNLCAVYGRLPIVLVIFAVTYFADANLVIWEGIPHRLKLLSYFLESPFQSGLAPTFYAWLANLCRDSAEKKQVVLALMNTMAYGTQAWSVPLQWNIKQAPRFFWGFRINLVVLAVVNLAFISAWVLERYDYRIVPHLAGNRRSFDGKGSNDYDGDDNYEDGGANQRETAINDYEEEEEEEEEGSRLIERNELLYLLEDKKNGDARVRVDSVESTSS